MNEKIQVNFKVTQEGVSISVYDMSRPRGSELFDEHWQTWAELGLTLHDEADSIESFEFIVKPDGSVSLNQLDGI